MRSSEALLEVLGVRFCIANTLPAAITVASIDNIALAHANMSNETASHVQQSSRKSSQNACVLFQAVSCTDEMPKTYGLDNGWTAGGLSLALA